MNKTVYKFIVQISPNLNTFAFLIRHAGSFYSKNNTIQKPNAMNLP